jgi:hypothetical protein
MIAENHLPKVIRATAFTTYFWDFAAEGFQRAIGKPFGRPRKGEIPLNTI